VGSALICAIAAAAAALDGPHFSLPRDRFLIDDRIPIVVEGLPPEARVSIEAKDGESRNPLASTATFVAGREGRVDLTTAAPVKGDYSGVDAMGLFWSARRERGPAAPPGSGEPPEELNAWTLSASIDGRVVAQTTIKRYAVDPSVRVTRVRDRGLVGTFYEPAGEGRHPAMIVLTGSGGGIPPPSGPAGGFASRGYAVLALAYFNAERLPATLSNIPLEYFGTALEWLASQPSVDADRIGVLGHSRGAELALLLGVVYPHLRLVVAVAPSNVVNRGCCDRFSAVAWTLGGRPVANTDIPVEKIHGPVLLISGRDDGVWRSTDMANAIVSRLEHNHFLFPYRSLVYEHAGHALARPYTITTNINSLRHPLTGNLMRMGGTPEGTAHAREDSWRQTLEFVGANLGTRHE
jgi:dienelactone hydrolase